MSNDSFLFTVLIVDIILKIPSILGFLFPFIGLMINLKNKNWNSGYFNFYAWFKIIECYLGVVILTLFIIIFFFVDKSAMDSKFQELFTGVVFTIILLMLIPIIVWNFYVSY